jgi:phospholipid/cholesterol/gamma-HCH transport system ATP-binding protein
LSDPAALQVRELTGPVGGPVIFDVNIKVPRHDLRLVLGPIHSGKTVVLRHIVGLECAERGTIALNGEIFDASGEPAEVRRRMQTRVGVVFAGSALVSRIGVLENVELPLLEHTDATPAEARESARELLAEVGLAVDEDVTPGRLTRAEQRRVALARAVALRPQVVLLDEPTLGLDSHAAHEFDETMTRLQQAHGFGALIFSHEVRHAFGRASHIYVLSGGRVVDQGDREALMRSSQETVRQLLHRRGAA